MKSLFIIGFAVMIAVGFDLTILHADPATRPAVAAGATAVVPEPQESGGEPERRESARRQSHLRSNT